jgi:sec-independent protein translocase protein TatA
MQLAAGLPFGLGPAELLIILAIVVVLFGATRLTDIGKGLGRGIKEFRKEMKDEDKAELDADKEPAATTTTTTVEDKTQTH